MSLVSFSYAVPYIFVFFVLFFSSVPIINTEKKIEVRKSSFIIENFLIIFLLLIFIGFRGFIQSDWLNYYRMFDNSVTFFDGKDVFDKYFKEFPLEPGFALFTIFIKSICNNYFFYQFVNYLIEFCILYTLFKRDVGKNFLMGFVFYFLFGCLTMSVNLLRNSKAILLFIISLKYVNSKKFFKYLICNLFGMLFHVSAVLYVPLYFLLKSRWNKKILISLFIVGNAFYIFQISWIKGILSLVWPFLGHRVGGMIQFYLKSDIMSSSYGISIGYLERLMTFFLVMHFREKLFLQNKINIIYANVFFIYMFIYLFTSEMSVMTDRLPMLFIFSYWFIYPQIYKLCTKKKKIYFLLILFFYGMLKMSRYNLIVMNYDNALFFYQPYEKRAEIFRKISKDW